MYPYDLTLPSVRSALVAFPTTLRISPLSFCMVHTNLLKWQKSLPALKHGQTR